MVVVVAAAAAAADIATGWYEIMVES